MFRIGFPVDGGTPETSFVVIAKLLRSVHHCVKGGRTSGLRDGSGALLVYERAPEHVRNQWCYEFELLPVPDNLLEQSPKYLCDFGYSDSVACALAVAQSQLGDSESLGQDPLLLVSCSFAPHAKNLGLTGLVLSKVTEENPDHAAESLRNKWAAARKSNALALILHENDAGILQRESGQKALALTKDLWRNLVPGAQPHIVSCRPDQLVLLIMALRLPPHLFVSGPKIADSERSRFSAGKREAVDLVIAVLFLAIALLFWRLMQTPAQEKESVRAGAQTERSRLSEMPGQNAGLSQELPAPEREAEAGGKRNLQGFTYLRTRTYSCGGQTRTVDEYLHDRTQIEFVLIPGGSSMMGSYESPREMPVHQVTLPSFLMSRCEVTQKTWKNVMGYNPSCFQGDDLPVDSVCWHQCQLFCGKTGLKLPTEAQWEYACRAGTTSRYYWGEEMSGEYCWYIYNSGEKTHPVGGKRPNAFGLHDMSGNVLECCAAWYGPYLIEGEVDPTGTRSVPPSILEARHAFIVLRGGGWHSFPRDCRSALRGGNAVTGICFNLGFRVVATVEPAHAGDYRSREETPQKDNLVFTYLRTTTYSCGGQTNTVEEYLHADTGMEFALLPGRSFMMGSNENSDEQPVHQVKLEPFLISRCEVTQDVWIDVMGYNPSQNERSDLPVEEVSWYECHLFCRETGFELPSEAQWEYACRAGTSGKYYWGEEMNGDYCWYEQNSQNVVHPVGKKLPNAFGLYDMTGNVMEWCTDLYGPYLVNGQTDASGRRNIPASMSDVGGEMGAILRGGCADTTTPDRCVMRDYRSSSRVRLGPRFHERLYWGNIGFRVIAPLARSRLHKSTAAKDDSSR